MLTALCRHAVIVLQRKMISTAGPNAGRRFLRQKTTIFLELFCGEEFLPEQLSRAKNVARF